MTRRDAAHLGHVIPKTHDHAQHTAPGAHRSHPMPDGWGLVQRHRHGPRRTLNSDPIAGDVTADPYNLRRFLDTQCRVYELAERELRAGRKVSHWMWFIFPQIKGLGHSAMAQRYAISSFAEAKGYLDHTLLGPRLSGCTQLVANLNGPSIEEIFGYPDYLKFQSSMTLFANATDDDRTPVTAHTHPLTPVG